MAGKIELLSIDEIEEVNTVIKSVLIANNKFSKNQQVLLAGIGFKLFSDLDAIHKSDYPALHKIINEWSDDNMNLIIKPRNKNPKKGEV